MDSWVSLFFEFQIYLFTSRTRYGLFDHILSFLKFNSEMSYLLIVFDIDS